MCQSPSRSSGAALSFPHSNVPFVRGRRPHSRLTIRSDTRISRFLRRPFALAAVPLVGLLGCIQAPTRTETVERRPLGREIPVYAAPKNSALPTHSAKLADSEARIEVESAPRRETVNLADALSLAMERNPALASFSWEVRSRQGRATQAGLLPNPTAQLTIEDFAGSGSLSGFSNSENTLRIAQRIPTAGKRRKGRRAADLGTEVAEWEFESARLRVYASVARAFANVLAAQEIVALNERLVEVARSSQEAVSKLVSAGAAPSVDQTRAALEVSAVKVDLKVARRDLKAAQVALVATWDGDTVAPFVEAKGELGLIEMPPARDEVRAQIDRNPLLKRWQSEIQRSRAVVELERARRIPDVTIGAGVRRAEGIDETALVTGISIPIAIFDRNQGNRTAARADLLKAKHELRDARVNLLADLEREYQEWVARYEEVRELRDSILPLAEEAYAGVRAGYGRGLFRNVDVLDSQRRLFQLRLREIGALRAYHGAEAAVEGLVGIALGSATASNEGTN